MSRIPQGSLDQLFLQARTHKNWQDRPVTLETLREIYDLMKWGPTAGNSSPLRLLFVTTPESKDKLLPCLDKGNVEKVRAAPVTAILAQDIRFFDQMTKLAPHMKDPKASYEGKDALIHEVAFRNSSLQGAYLMIAARALGLDCGPMSGFDNKMVDETFFAGTSWKSNFICSLGYGISEKLFPRAPRLDFDEACKVI